MNKINIKQFINEQVRVDFIDGEKAIGWFVRDKYHTNRWSILYLTDSRSISFVKSQIKSITWLSNGYTVKYSEIEFKGI